MNNNVNNNNVRNTIILIEVYWLKDGHNISGTIKKQHVFRQHMSMYWGVPNTVVANEAHSVVVNIGSTLYYIISESKN